MIDTAANTNQDLLSQALEDSDRSIAAAMTILDAVNLDEVTVEELKIAVIEHRPEAYTDEGGVERTRNRSYVRHAYISTHVPNRVFNQMIAGRAQLLKDLKRRGIADKAEIQLEQAKWAINPVWWVWKLSEEDMTLERLDAILSGMQTQKLFLRFFADRTLPQKK